MRTRAYTWDNSVATELIAVLPIFGLDNLLHLMVSRRACRNEKTLGGIHKQVSIMLNIKFTLSSGGGLARDICHITEVAAFTV